MTATDPRRFRHRTAEVEAVQWTGSNAEQMRAFVGVDFDEIDPEDRGENPDATAAVRESRHGEWRGLEPGWWVVKIGDELYEESDADFVASFAPATASVPDLIAKAVEALQARAGELQELAEEQMRPSLEERAQEWLEAAAIVQRIGRKGAQA